MKKSTLLRMIGFWPPYFGAGVRVRKISSDLRLIEVEMKLRFWNKNYVGTQFGGSLYSMVDPFYMLMLMENMGRDYVIWDKAASIRFKKPGRGRVHARFALEQSQIDSIKAQAASQEKVEPRFQVQILDESGDVVAEVEKVLSVRHKEKVKTHF